MFHYTEKANINKKTQQIHRPTGSINDLHVKTHIAHSKVRDERQHFHQADEKLSTMTTHHVAEGQGKQELAYSQLN